MFHFQIDLYCDLYNENSEIVRTTVGLGDYYTVSFLV